MDAFESLSPEMSTSILDIGAACGGLGLALLERFGCKNYLGLEIHEGAAAIGNEAVSTFGRGVLSGDILDGEQIFESLGLPQEYDLVVSLSALDWNEDVRENVQAAWRHVAEGGKLLMSLRLHPTICLLDLESSYQSTSPEILDGDEIAPYVIMSIPAAIEFAKSLGVARATVFGYWGQPSATAVTTLDRCIFAVAVLEKDSRFSAHNMFAIDWPTSLELEALGCL